MSSQRVFTIAEAVLAYNTSESTIRRAIRKTSDDGKYPPPLRAKRKGTKGKGSIVIHVDDLDAWIEAHEDVA